MFFIGFFRVQFFIFFCFSALCFLFFLSGELRRQARPCQRTVQFHATFAVPIQPGTARLQRSSPIDLVCQVFVTHRGSSNTFLASSDLCLSRMGRMKSWTTSNVYVALAASHIFAGASSLWLSLQQRTQSNVRLCTLVTSKALRLYKDWE